MTDMNNPGKYDDLCAIVREAAQAEVIVVNGNKGSGFSVQGTRMVIVGLPDMLEFIAGEIRKDLP